MQAKATPPSLRIAPFFGEPGRALLGPVEAKAGGAFWVST